MADDINAKNNDLIYIFALILAIVLTASDHPNIGNFGGLDLVGWTGVDFAKLIGTFVSLSVMAVIAIFLINKNYGLDLKDSRQLIFFIIQVVVYFGFGLTQNFMAMIHILTCITIVSLVKNDKSVKWEEKFGVVNILILCDFFIYPLLEYFSSLGGMFLFFRGIRFFFSPYVVYTTYSGFTQSSAQVIKLAFGILTFVIMVIPAIALSGGNIYTIQRFGTADMQQYLAATNVFRDTAEFWKGMGAAIVDGVDGFGKMFDPNTYSGNYEGEQEESEDPQGVFLKEYDLGDLKYFEGNQVYVWAILEAKTLENRLDIEVRCTAKSEDETIPPIEGVLDDKTKAKVRKIPVYSGVTTNVICIFDNLAAGGYEINLTADFDFGADLPKRIFLMHKDRVMSDRVYLAQQGIDPTPESILQKNNINDFVESESSTGPVLLQIASDPLLWEIPYPGYPFFGVKVENNWGTGTLIRKIKDFYLKVPEPMLLVGCTQFDPKLVGSSDPQDEKGYNTYRIDTPSLIDVKEAIAVGCPIDVDARSLDPEPVTRRFIKAHVDYSYSLSVRIPIEVQKLATI